MAIYYDRRDAVHYISNPLFNDEDEEEEEEVKIQTIQTQFSLLTMQLHYRGLSVCNVPRIQKRRSAFL